MTPSSAQLAWSGSARVGRVTLLAPAGNHLTFTELAPLAEHLRDRADPWGGFVQVASALGSAMHAVARVQHECGDAAGALDEAGFLLHGLPVHGIIARMRGCLERHRDVLTGRECAARLVLEAKRIQREQTEAVAMTVNALRSIVPGSGTILLAWPGGPACDLGDGLLTGPLMAGRPRGGDANEILIAGPEPLAAQACASLNEHGIAAMIAGPEVATPSGRFGPLAAVLVRCVGDTGLAEPAAVELANDAARRGVQVIGIGVRTEPFLHTAGLAPLPTQRTRIFIHPPVQMP